MPSYGLKPVAPYLNTTHHLVNGRNLFAALPLFEGAGRETMDVVRREILLRGGVGGSWSWVSTPEGPALRQNSVHPDATAEWRSITSGGSNMDLRDWYATANNDEFTIEVIARLHTSAIHGGYFHIEGMGATSWCDFFADGRQDAVYNGTTIDNTVPGGVPFVLNQWYAFHFVKNGNTITIYRDGVVEETASKSGTWDFNGTDFIALGFLGAFGKSLKSDILHAALWADGLSPSEILERATDPWAIYTTPVVTPPEGGDDWEEERRKRVIFDQCSTQKLPRVSDPPALAGISRTHPPSFEVFRYILETLRAMVAHQKCVEENILPAIEASPGPPAEPGTDGIDGSVIGAVAGVMGWGAPVEESYAWPFPGPPGPSGQTSSQPQMIWLPSAPADDGQPGPPGVSGSFADIDISTLGYWSTLANGDPVTPEVVFDAFGDTIAVWTPTP